MANKASDVRVQINENDLSTPTSSQKYPLGTVFECVDSSYPNGIKQFMYVKSHGALTAYVPYKIVGKGTSGSEWITAAPATLSAPVTLIGIPQVAFTSGYYGFVQIAGSATYATGSAAIAANASLKVKNAGVVLVTDSSSGTQSSATIAWNVSATTTSATSGLAILQAIRAVITT